MIVEIFAFLGALSLLTYLVPWILQSFYTEQNLKTKYSAQWGLVTGASSGIGKAITEKLCNQGINVVMVALDDQTLKDSVQELKGKFPKIQIRACGTNLATPDFMPAIIATTKDIEINLVFNNAGYITTGFFHNVPLERWIQNTECNSTAALRITHHFLNLMIPRGDKGLITFTSSSAGFIANPLASTYASTKASLTTFASSLAPEIKEFGIDVVVVHPSPIQSNFLSNAGGMKILEASGKIAAAPTVIAETLFACAGRCVVRDQGLTSFGVKLLVKIVDWNFLADIMPHVAFLMGDYNTFKAKLTVKPKKQ